MTEVCARNELQVSFNPVSVAALPLRGSVHQVVFLKPLETGVVGVTHFMSLG